MFSKDSPPGVSDLWPVGHIQPRTATNVGQHEIINVLKALWFYDFENSAVQFLSFTDDVAKLGRPFPWLCPQVSPRWLGLRITGLIQCCLSLLGDTSFMVALRAVGTPCVPIFHPMRVYLELGLVG